MCDTQEEIPLCGMDHSATERLSVGNVWPSPVIVGATCIYENVTFLYERLIQLGIVRACRRNHVLSSIRPNDLYLPLIAFMDPFGADNLMTSSDVLA